MMQILSILLVGIALAPAFAHAFEFPGKKRLERSAYVTVQSIYYPGFTLLGISEPSGLIAVLILLFLTSPSTASFWLIVIALIGLAGMQMIYWVFTHPTNKFWLQTSGTDMSNLGNSFFALGPRSSRTAKDWEKLRNRWEYSHIARAGLAFLSFFSLVLTIIF
jgi:hypothetical protein